MKNELMNRVWQRILLQVDQIDWMGIALVGVRSLVILLVAWLLTVLTKILLRRMERRLAAQRNSEEADSGEDAKRFATIFSLIRQVAMVGLWITASLMILKEWSVEIGPILASAGVVGLAVGFGAQNLVRDLITGFFLILENQVRVGDVVSINGETGLVEKIQLRTLSIRSVNGVVHIIPNGNVNSVSNLTHKWSAYLFNLGVGYSQDIDKVIECIRSVGAELLQDPKFGSLMLEPIEVFGLDKFDSSAIVIQGRLRTLPGRHMDVGREFQRRIKLAFDQLHIDIPFNQQVLHFGPGAAQEIQRMISGVAGEKPG